MNHPRTQDINPLPLEDSRVYTFQYHAYVLYNSVGKVKKYTATVNSVKEIEVI